MKNNIFTILFISLLLIGCTEKKDPVVTVEPNPKAQTLQPSPKRNSQIKIIQKPKLTPKVYSKQSQIDTVKQTIDKTTPNKTKVLELLTKVYSILDSKVYNNNFEKLVKNLWPKLQKIQQKNLLSKFLQTESLSRSYMGRKPYSLVNILIKLQLNQEFTFYVLDALKNNQQPSLTVAKKYLSLRYKKSLGSNYYEWKQLIIKSN
ncbi:MAG: hypothetical protein KC646_03240 [Candidatus Cloacimonetes bacterium]|nr:hypothetical protein [Candidatus Cloacimonadota bacterium]